MCNAVVVIEKGLVMLTVVTDLMVESDDPRCEINAAATPPCVRANVARVAKANRDGLIGKIRGRNDLCEQCWDSI
jgi:hypothetical protein